MLGQLFASGQLIEFLIVSIFMGVAIGLILYLLPFLAISALNCFLIGLVSSVVVFSLLVAFGGSGSGGGQGEGKGGGNTVQTDNIKPEGSSNIKPESSSSELEEPQTQTIKKPEIDGKTLLITIDGYNFIVDNQEKTFEELDSIVNQKLSEKSVNKIIFHYNALYRTKAYEQTIKLADKYSNSNVVFEQRYEDE